MNYTTRYVHKITPSDKDVGPGITLYDHHFADRRTLGEALRIRGILCSGQAIRDFRHEGTRVVVFPRSSIWHSIILETNPE